MIGDIDGPVGGGSVVEVSVDRMEASVGSMVVALEYSGAAIPFVRNGWGVPELEATYDEDEDVIPAFVEVVPGDEVAGRAVVKYCDAMVGWRYLVHAEVDVMKLCAEGMNFPVMKLIGSEENSFLESGRSDMWGRLCGELRWRLLRMRGEVVSGGLNYQSPRMSLIDSDPGCVEKFARPEIGGEGEFSEMNRRVGFRRALDGELISRTRYPRAFHFIGHFRDAQEAMDAWRVIDDRRKELMEKDGDIRDYVAFLERRAGILLGPEVGSVGVGVDDAVGDLPLDVDIGV